MNIKIETIASSPIAYIRRCGAYGVENIQIMENLKSWAAKSNLMNDNTIILGIVYDDVQSTRPENCRYDACIILADDTIKEEGVINLGNIDGGKYAVFIIEHTVQAIEQAWFEIFPELFKSGYLLDAERPIMERYATKNVSNNICEICIPIL